MVSAAGELLLRADRLVRSGIAGLKVEEGIKFGGGVGASELDLCLCGDRLDDSGWRRVGDVVLSCRSFKRCWVMRDGC